MAKGSGRTTKLGGEASYARKVKGSLMTSWTRPSGGSSRTLSFTGKREMTNGIKNMKGRGSTARYGLGSKGF